MFETVFRPEGAKKHPKSNLTQRHSGQPTILDRMMIYASISRWIFPISGSVLTGGSYWLLIRAHCCLLPAHDALARRLGRVARRTFDGTRG
jgi:hypothetical protein